MLCDFIKINCPYRIIYITFPYSTQRSLFNFDYSFWFSVDSLWLSNRIGALGGFVVYRN